MWGDDAERAALRAVAHLLPGKRRQIIEVVAAAVPPTPEQRIPAPTDAAAKRLEQIQHIVVLMLENRSFDHRLGYLSLPTALGGRDRADVDGLRGPDTNFNMHEGTRYPIYDLAQTELTGEAEDPDHSGGSVDQQLANGGRGFVDNFARVSLASAKQLNAPLPDPGLVMATTTAMTCRFTTISRASTVWSIAGSARCRGPRGRTGCMRSRGKRPGAAMTSPSRCTSCRLSSR